MINEIELIGQIKGEIVKREFDNRDGVSKDTYVNFNVETLEYNELDEQPFTTYHKVATKNQHVINKLNKILETQEKQKNIVAALQVPIDGLLAKYKTQGLTQLTILRAIRAHNAKRLPPSFTQFIPQNQYHINLINNAINQSSLSINTLIEHTKEGKPILDTNIAIKGSLTVSKYEKNGKNQYSTQINLTDVSSIIPPNLPTSQVTLSGTIVGELYRGQVSENADMKDFPACPYVRFSMMVRVRNTNHFHTIVLHDPNLISFARTGLTYLRPTNDFIKSPDPSIPPTRKMEKIELPLTAGTPIQITGRINKRTQEINLEKRYYTEIIANSLTITKNFDYKTSQGEKLTFDIQKSVLVDPSHDRQVENYYDGLGQTSLLFNRPEISPRNNFLHLVSKLSEKTNLSTAELINLIYRIQKNEFIHLPLLKQRLFTKNTLHFKKILNQLKLIKAIKKLHKKEPSRPIPLKNRYRLRLKNITNQDFKNFLHRSRNQFIASNQYLKAKRYYAVLPVLGKRISTKINRLTNKYSDQSLSKYTILKTIRALTKSKTIDRWPLYIKQFLVENKPTFDIIISDMQRIAILENKPLEKILQTYINRIRQDIPFQVFKDFVKQSSRLFLFNRLNTGFRLLKNRLHLKNIMNQKYKDFVRRSRNQFIANNQYLKTIRYYAVLPVLEKRISTKINRLTKKYSDQSLSRYTILKTIRALTKSKTIDRWPLHIKQFLVENKPTFDIIISDMQKIAILKNKPLEKIPQTYINRISQNKPLTESFFESPAKTQAKAYKHIEKEGRQADSIPRTRKNQPHFSNIELANKRLSDAQTLKNQMHLFKECVKTITAPETELTPQLAQEYTSLRESIRKTIDKQAPYYPTAMNSIEQNDPGWKIYIAQSTRFYDLELKTSIEIPNLDTFKAQKNNDITKLMSSINVNTIPDQIPSTAIPMSQTFNTLLKVHDQIDSTSTLYNVAMTNTETKNQNYSTFSYAIENLVQTEKLLLQINPTPNKTQSIEQPISVSSTLTTFSIPFTKPEDPPPPLPLPEPPPIQYIKEGNLLNSKAQLLVNMVDCKGFSTGETSAQFKESFPQSYKAYRQQCRTRSIKTGEVFLTGNKTNPNSKWIAHFPTHFDSKKSPEISWIQEGLVDLANKIREHGFTSIAIPPLGCGFAGLDWNKIKPLIENTLKDIPNLKIEIYEPSQSQKLTTFTYQ